MAVSRVKVWLKRSVFAGLGVAAVMGAYLGGLQLTGNFHTVIAGELYRSAQPSASAIESYAKQYGIKTVVNLRGENDKSSWYDKEVAVSKKLGIKHIDFSMLASRQLTPAEADRLLALLKDAPKPILIHCRSGADRTGLVSVLYSQQIAGISEDQAEKQLSIFYGHVGIPYLSAAYAMDKSWEKLERHYGLDGYARPAPITVSAADEAIPEKPAS
jgi:protein tyrosine/serine phosphatase